MNTTDNTPSAPSIRKNFGFTPEFKLDARRAKTRLLTAGLDWSLDYAVSVAMDALGKHARADIGSLPLADAITEFLENRQRKRTKSGAKLRSATLTFYTFLLETKFAAAFPDRNIGDISRTEIARYVEGQGDGDWRAIRALFRWAATKEPALIANDPTFRLKPEVAPGSRPREFLPVEKVAEILRNAGEYTHAAAIAFFAGLRPSEIATVEGKEPLRWEHIDREAKLIRLDGRTTKNGKPRIIQGDGIFPVLWDWLADAPKEGPVCGITDYALTKAFKRAGGYGDKQDWPHDGTRHSYATYHVALYQNAGITAHAMGHANNLSMFYNHYCAQATRLKAEKFAGLSPQVVRNQIKIMAS